MLTCYKAHDDRRKIVTDWTWKTYAHLLDEKADPFQSDKPRWYWLMNLSAERGV